MVDVADPQVGPKDILLKIRACGICGSDAFYTSLGGLPGLEGRTPLGHEPAGEVVEVGSEVLDIPIGAHVVIDPMAAPSGIIGSGGTSGGMAEYLLIENAVLGRSVAIIPDHIPFEVAALNEPMAVARHAVNRTDPKPGARVVIFGAGPSASALRSATSRRAPRTSWSSTCFPRVSRRRCASELTRSSTPRKKT